MIESAIDGLEEVSQDVKIHRLALVHPTAKLGPGTVVWPFAQICAGTVLCPHCAVGHGVYIGNDANLGEGVRIQSNAFICNMAKIGDYVFIGQGTIMGNDKHPRVNNPSYKRRPPIIESHVNLGMGCVILPGVRIGRGATIGAGSVVTKDVEPSATMIGNPGRILTEK
ncbi:N-acetyltransferase [Candidatus Pacearchaeota archaeon]|nr:N-acetyltransferase [Candidatus Pacearchaeota archaeon]|tara:strand:+ start:3626 stop:4129 length:504 start_codon:yes stop_codon:yes gene_type:complete